MAGELERQRFERDDLLAHEICHRVFRSRNEVEVAPLDLEEVVLEFCEAGDAVGAFAAHHVRHVDLGIPVLLSVRVEHELRERAMQARQRAFHHDEAGAGKLRRRLEVEHAETRTDVDMILRREIEFARLTPAAILRVLFRRAPSRNRFVREIGNDANEFVELALNLRELFFGRLEGRLEPFRFLHPFRYVLFLRLGLPDLLCKPVAIRLRAFHGLLQLLATSVESLEPGYIEYVSPSRSKPFSHAFDVIPQQLDVDHFLFLSEDSSRLRSSCSFSRMLASSPRSVGRYHCTAGMPSGK